MPEVTWDPSLEVAVQRFEESAFSAQVRVDSLHPLDREVFKATLREQIVSFYADMHRGYDVLVQTALDMSASTGLSGKPPTKGRFLRSIRHLFPSQDAVDALSDESHIDRLIEEGKPLFQVFGLSVQGVTTMYEVACHLLDENRNEDARAAFRLILVLAPHVGDFWTGHGVALLRLEHFSEAVSSLERACSQDPESTQSLLLLCRALIGADRKGEAEARLNARMDEAAREGNRELYEVLESARFELARFSK